MRGIGSSILTAALAAALVVAGMPHALCFCGCADGHAQAADPQANRPADRPGETAARSGACPCCCGAERLGPAVAQEQQAGQPSDQSSPDPPPCRCADCQPVLAVPPNGQAGVAPPAAFPGWLWSVVAPVSVTMEASGPGVAHCGPGPPDTRLPSGSEICLLLGRLLF